MQGNEKWTTQKMMEVREEMMKKIDMVIRVQDVRTLAAINIAVDELTK